MYVNLFHSTILKYECLTTKEVYEILQSIISLITGSVTAVVYVYT